MEVKWFPDALAPCCGLCREEFSFFTRRHHCRQCGKVVCADCSSHQKKLALRVCQRCVQSDDNANHLSSASFHTIQTKNSAAKNKLHPTKKAIGVVYGKIVEANIYPSANPFLFMYLEGEEKGLKQTSVYINMKSTKREDTFHFNLYDSSAILKMELFNHFDLNSSSIIHTNRLKIGSGELYLDKFLDQQYHPQALTLNDQGCCVKVLLHFKFNSIGDQLVFFSGKKRPHVDYNSNSSDNRNDVHSDAKSNKGPPFKEGKFMANLLFLVDPVMYIYSFWCTIYKLLTWETPSKSIFAFAVVLYICQNVQWCVVYVHVLLLYNLLSNYFWLHIGGQSCISHCSTTITSRSKVYMVLAEEMHKLIYNYKSTNPNEEFTEKEIERLLCMQNLMKLAGDLASNIQYIYCWKNKDYSTRIVITLISSCMVHLCTPGWLIMALLVSLLFLSRINYDYQIPCYLLGIKKYLRFMTRQCRFQSLDNENPIST